VKWRILEDFGGSIGKVMGHMQMGEEKCEANGEIKAIQSTVTRF
jgi:hypothetical protein